MWAAVTSPSALCRVAEGAQPMAESDFQQDSPAVIAYPDAMGVTFDANPDLLTPHAARRVNGSIGCNKNDNDIHSRQTC